MRLKHSDSIGKDRPFFENFIINSLNFAFEKVESVVENRKGEDRNCLTLNNIGILSFLGVLLKPNIFLSSKEYDSIFTMLLSLCHKVESKLVWSDFDVLDKFKKLLVTKAYYLLRLLYLLFLRSH